MSFVFNNSWWIFQMIMEVSQQFHMKLTSWQMFKSLTFMKVRDLNICQDVNFMWNCCETSIIIWKIHQELLKTKDKKNITGILWKVSKNRWNNKKMLIKTILSYFKGRWFYFHQQKATWGNWIFYRKTPHIALLYNFKI